jgi:hypothetical protein
MKNQVKITNKMMIVDFEFPITVGQVKLVAVAQAYVSKHSETGLLTGDFEFTDQHDETYMDMPVEGYGAWKKLKEFHLEFGVDLQKLVADEFYKVVTEDFQKEFLSKFDVKNFEIN